VTTSPGFVREYFHPVQNHRGDIYLLENKVYPSAHLAEAEGKQEPAENGLPWVVGCFGAFRCRRSLELMREIATKLEGRVRFVLRGYPAGTIADEFHGLIDGCEGIEFLGPYAYPEDLAKIYGAIDFNWAFDESDPNGNSAWLLPNRIYEGGCFGIPALASATTETGRWIASREAGWTFSEPLAASLTDFFETISPEEWRAVRGKCAARPRTDFTGEGDYTKLTAEILRKAESA
jgi:succinoglycan biosynthesis protein ExoL